MHTSASDPATPPLIGITGRKKTASLIDGFNKSMAPAEVDLAMTDYARCVSAGGGLPVYLPLDVDPVALAARLDGFVFTGGSDITPDLYGAVADPDLGPIEPARDSFELALLQAVLEAGVPAIGVCRGLQLFNVARGGTLHQHVPSHAHDEDPMDLLSHSVSFAPGSTFEHLYGSSTEVNSLHHQAIDVLGGGIVATGHAPDGLVEAIEFDDARVLGVQWHPEMFQKADPLFDWLVEAAGERGARATR
jgi:putative glutamine amidotransferase